MIFRWCLVKFYTETAIYEKVIIGGLSEKNAEQFISEYEKEQSELETNILELENKINLSSEENLKSENFLELVTRYTDFSKLTTPMLNEFINKVYVHEKEENKNQQVDIHFNFIGNFKFPENMISPIELETQRLELEAKKKRSLELKEIRYKKELQRRRDITSRKKEGLLNDKELEKYNKRLEKNRVNDRKRYYENKIKLQTEG